MHIKYIDINKIENRRSPTCFLTGRSNRKTFSPNTIFVYNSDFVFIP